MAGDSRLARLAPLLFFVLAALPLQGVLLGDRFVGDPMGELPVKLWVVEAFSRIGVLGGMAKEIGFPYTGPLNNADPAGTVVTGLLRPLIGRILAYDLYIYLELLASMFAAWWLASEVVRDRLAALVAGVVYGLSPLVLAYAVTGAITDILNLWPYPLALVGLLRALGAPAPLAAMRWGIFGGAMGGLGFATCPYDFVVFAALAFPFLLFVRGAWSEGLTLGEAPVRPDRRTLVAALVATLVALVVVGGIDAVYIRTMMNDPNSQMSTDTVGATRHFPPYKFLEPGHRDRYVAYLADYVAVGKDAVIERTTASRFYRAFAPGFVTLGLAVVALVPQRRKVALLWAGSALFCALASTGPFLPVTREIAFVQPVNLTWLLTQHLLPGGNLILEPFRYALSASLALGVVAAIGAQLLARKVGRWVLPLLPAIVAAEIFVVSPAPFPIATARLQVPAIYTELERYLPPGPILELPYFDRGSDRMMREQFFYQLFHHRPIANEVVGFAPRYLRDNQFTAELLAIEKSTGLLKVEVTDRDRVEADKARLATDGFVGIVVWPPGYRSNEEWQAARRLLDTLARPTPAGDRLIYPLGTFAGASPAPATTPTSNSGAVNIQGNTAMIAVTPVYHGTVRIESGGVVVWVDPWSKARLDGPKADVLLLTDIHPDHLDPDAIAKVVREGTTIVAPPAVAEALTAYKVGKVLKNGEVATLGGITVTAVPMYNLVRGPEEGKVFHEKGRGNGYLVRIDGRTLYIAGDTECTPEMRALTGIDLALLPMNLPYTMTPQEAATCAAAFKPGKVTPYHYAGSDLTQFAPAGVDVVLRDAYPGGLPW